MNGHAMDSGIGQSPRRKEDQRLVTGQGRFTDDVNLSGQIYAAVVRSPHAHALILRIETAAARSVPGVHMVATATDLATDGVNPIPHVWSSNNPPDILLVNRDGTERESAPHRVLPVDAVRFVGEAVAMVVAETPAAAKDGAERVEIEYQTLPSVTATAEAVLPRAPKLWDHMRSNLCVDADVGDAAAAEVEFARAPKIARIETWVQRVTGVHMEPRAALAEYDATSGRYVVHAGSGGVVRQKRELTGILGVAEDRCRMIAGDIGGNFGTRNSFYPETALVAWAARRLGRPVKWTAERQEAFLSDFQGRDLVVNAELALDDTGNFLAFRGSNISNLGNCTVSLVPLTKGVEIMTGVYRIPAAYFRARAVHSNTPPTNPYRSAGRPEVMFVIERLIDIAARQFGFDPVALRRRNLVPESAMPYANRLGMTYDSGAYEKAMDAALALADWDGFPARRAASRERGRLRGRGLANYVETSTGAPRERAHMTVRPEGRVDVVIGTLSAGQGHETSFAQLVCEWLGVPFECVRLITGDTDVAFVGGGSHSGRSMRLAGIVVGQASKDIEEKGRRIAVHLLETAEADLEFARGRYTVRGTDRSIGLFEVAAAALGRADLPDDLRGPLAAECDETVRTPAFPYGAHVCEVEVDPETGFVEIVRYAGVDDVGRAINPLILHGQAHGAIVQGLGQALLEQCHYDAASGQMLSASFMDYAIPRADDMPSFLTEISEVPSPTNPLGIRAGGEGGTTPALAALINAIVDALAELGVTHVEMPATPERVWRTIAAARAGSG